MKTFLSFSILTYFICFNAIGQTINTKYYIHEYFSTDQIKDDLVEERANTYIFPQLSGMSNKKVQDDINSSLSIEYNTEGMNLVYIDSGETPYLRRSHIEVDTSKIKIYDSTYNSQGISWQNNTSTTTIDIIDNHYASITNLEEMEGNMGAHPNFSQFSYVIGLTNGDTLTFNSFLEGDYLNTLRKIILLQKDHDEGWSDLYQTWSNKIIGESIINGLTKEFIILRADSRTLGGGEISRQILEIKISFRELEKYIRK